MRDEELKKCPFCGGEASLTVKVAIDHYNAQYHCKGCRAEAQASYLNKNRDLAIAEARENWNRRV